jgi:predicted ATPase
MNSATLSERKRRRVRNYSQNILRILAEPPLRSDDIKRNMTQRRQRCRVRFTSFLPMGVQIMLVSKYFAAGSPVVMVATFDESRLEFELANSGRRVFAYSAAGVIVERENGSATAATWAQAFAFIASERNAVLIVRDLQHVIRNAPVYRALIDATAALKSNGSAVVAVAPAWQLPAELQHVAPVIAQPLPSRAELAAPLASIVAAAGVAEPNAEHSAALLDAAAGLTIDESENAFALSLVELGKLDAGIVQREKMRLIASTGFLSVEQPAPLASIGGLAELKSYLVNEVLPVQRDKALRVRGVILAGAPGVGKSLAAKACGAALSAPIVRLDVSGCKGSLVGQSEANIRQATAMVDAIAPCVLWIDEIEKAVAGSTGGGTASDGGTAAGMLGHLLTWLQETTAAVFVIATCNDYQALPPELTRAGRFDERFVVDLPSESERAEIATVHLSRFGCSAELAATIAAATPNYTGAEIEQLVKSAARLSGRRIAAEHINAAAASIKPIAIVQKEKIDAFRAWARRSLRSANSAEQSTPVRLNGNRAALGAAFN